MAVAVLTAVLMKVHAAQLADSRDVRKETQNGGGSRHKLSWSIRSMSVS